MPAFARRQRSLLAEAARVVAPGGRLVYATCSSEPEENEEVVEAFLSGQQGFARTAITGAPVAAFIDARGDFRTLPHRDGLEAFYAAVLTRTL